jgi:putative hydrolase of the HAD superfamily
MRFVDHFQAIFFDMNGTFMFGHDRLGSDQDFFATYRNLGGGRLTSDEVQDRVLRICGCLQRDYNNPAYFECFPKLLEAVSIYGQFDGQDALDIANVIAAHEVGQVPSWAATTLQTLSATHPLAVVSNVWAPAEAWTNEFARSGLVHVFRCRVFSSSIGAVKPSPRVFWTALEQMGVEPSRALFVGDSIERDIQPARKLGFSTVFVGPGNQNTGADLTVSSIAELMAHAAAHRPNPKTA